MKLTSTSALLAATLLAMTPVLAQSDNPATARPNPFNPSGSGTSTSGGRDDNGDQGRDRMSPTTGQAQPQTSKEPARSDTTGQQKAGGNAEGRAGAR